MGQDIHGWVEVAWNPPHDWAGVISVGVLVERNRMFWGWLLRDEGNFGPIAAQRGVPADASPEVRQRVAEVQRFIESKEVHSFTWITWSELERINWDEGPLEGRQPMSLVLKGMVGEGAERRPDLEPVQLLTRRDTLGDSPGWQLLFDLMRRLAQTYGADNVRDGGLVRRVGSKLDNRAKLIVRCCLCEEQRIEFDARLTNVIRGKGVNFCPEAWYLQRTGAERNAAAQRRLDDGVRAHQHIGRHTDHLRDLGHSRRWLLITIALLVAFLLLQVVISQSWMPQL